MKENKRLKKFENELFFKSTKTFFIKNKHCPDCSNVSKAVLEISAWLLKKKMCVIIGHEFKKEMENVHGKNKKVFYWERKENKIILFESLNFIEYDAMITIGGDGTLLDCCYLFQDRTIFVISFNEKATTGHLISFSFSVFHNVVNCFLNNKIDYCLRERISVLFLKEKERRSVLNEVVIKRCMLEPIFYISVYIDEEFFGEYKGDGLIISTQTGSSGYSYSAGGPIVQTDVPSFIITPICPCLNTLSHSTVVSSNKKIKIKFPNKNRSSLFSAELDRKEVIKFDKESEIEIKKSSFNVFTAKTLLD